jgi:hypothetical protein
MIPRLRISSHNTKCLQVSLVSQHRFHQPTPTYVYGQALRRCIITASVSQPQRSRVQPQRLHPGSRLRQLHPVIRTTCRHFICTHTRRRHCYSNNSMGAWIRAMDWSRWWTMMGQDRSPDLQLPRSGQTDQMKKKKRYLATVSRTYGCERDSMPHLSVSRIKSTTFSSLCTIIMNSDTMMYRPTVCWDTISISQILSWVKQTKN